MRLRSTLSALSLRRAEARNSVPGHPLRRLALVLMCAAALVQAGPAMGASLPKDTGEYVYYAQNATAGKVLGDFCTNFGIRLQLAPGINERLNGKLTGASGSDFLNNLSATLGLAWFYHAGTLYISRLTEWQSKSFPVSRDTMPGLKQALSDLGVLEPRFGWATIPDQGMVLVSGPKDYIELVSGTLRSLQLAPSGQQIAVFRLKHAMAEDRIVVLRDQKTVVPGIATVLRNLLGGSRNDQQHQSRRTMPADGRRLFTDISGQGESAVPRIRTAADEEAQASSRDGSRNIGDASRAVTIESDARLNAILIKDSPEAMPMYEKLIAELDVPVGLVEIEAMTVDIEKSRLDELGVDWSASGRSGLSLGVGDAARDIKAGDIAMAYKSPATIFANQAASLLAKIRALESVGDARVIGKPSVLTTDNLSAIIDLSQTVYVQVKGERVASLSPVTAGVMLRVTPHVIECPGQPSEVHLIIDIEDGVLTGGEQPSAQRSTISTQATLLENESLLIGGYDTETDKVGGYRVPGLSKAPLFGALFRNESTENRQRKRLFLITPRIVSLAGAGRRNENRVQAASVSVAPDIGMKEVQFPPLTERNLQTSRMIPAPVAEQPVIQSSSQPSPIAVVTVAEPKQLTVSSARQERIVVPAVPALLLEPSPATMASPPATASKPSTMTRTSGMSPPLAAGVPGAKVAPAIPVAPMPAPVAVTVVPAPAPAAPVTPFTPAAPIPQFEADTTGRLDTFQLSRSIYRMR
jgi:type III secretion protein C